MSELRLYKDAYRIDSSNVTGETYTLIDPFFISASTYNFYSGGLIESVGIIKESVGRYYVSLNPILYTFSDIYEIKWFINYLSNSTVKVLKTRFRFNPYNITGIEVDLDINNTAIEIEIIR